MSSNAWTAVTALCATAAIGSSLFAVTLSSRDVDAGYRLGELRREAVVLRRQARAASQRVARLRAPQALLARAKVMGLPTTYPAIPLEVTPADIRYDRKQAERELEAFARAGDR